MPMNQRTSLRISKYLIAAIAASVVVAVSVWLTRQVYLVHQRGQFFEDPRNDLFYDPSLPPSPQLPWLWTVLGEEGYSNYIPLSRDRFTEKDLERVRAMFPECTVDLISEDNIRKLRNPANDSDTTDRSVK